MGMTPMVTAAQEAQALEATRDVAEVHAIFRAVLFARDALRAQLAEAENQILVERTLRGEAPRIQEKVLRYVLWVLTRSHDVRADLGDDVQMAVDQARTDLDAAVALLRERLPENTPALPLEDINDYYDDWYRRARAVVGRTA